jgi:hypothetical protein
MAITATNVTVHDGERNHSVLLTGLCDGTGSDETNERKVDVSELLPVGGKVKVNKITYSVAYGAVKLSWDASPPEDFIILDGDGVFDFRSSGGLINRADAETATGDILLTTLGFDLNSSYSIKLDMVKKPV